MRIKTSLKRINCLNKISISPKIRSKLKELSLNHKRLEILLIYRKSYSNFRLNIKIIFLKAIKSYQKCQQLIALKVWVARQSIDL